jgi:hypothetical protein
MLHVWLVPALILLFVLLFSFYLFIKFRGGTGVRTDGRTLVDKPDEESPPEE